MALGTITQLQLSPHTKDLDAVNPGGLKMTLSTVVGDASYPTGGTAVTASQLGFPGPDATLIAAVVVGVQGSAANSTGVVGFFNNATGKLQVFVSAGTEAANTTNVSGNTYTILAFGF